MAITMVQTVANTSGQALRAATEAAAKGAGTPANPAAPQQAGMPSYHALGLVPTGTQTGGPLGQMATDMLGQVHTQVGALASKLPEHLKNSAPDAVTAAKNELTPGKDTINPSTALSANGKDDAVAALSKTFDHAIFMAMVNQVISGVGDTARSLIRQS